MKKKTIKKHIIGIGISEVLVLPVLSMIYIMVCPEGGSGPGPTKGGRVTKTMKIQPKVMSPSSVQQPQPQVISIVNSSSVPKLTLPKTGE